MAQPSKNRRLRLTCLAACFGLTVGLSASAEADTSHLPSLPIIEADSIDDLWVCDLVGLHIYLVDDATTAAGAYYESGGALYHVNLDDELIMGFEERMYTTIYLHAPENYGVVYKIDGGSELSAPYHVVVESYFSRVYSDLSTYDFAARELGQQAPDKAPSLGKVRVQSHDRCPPPKDGEL